MADEEEDWSSTRVAWEGDRPGLVRRCPESTTVESDRVHEGYTLNLYAGTPRGEIVVMRVRAGGDLLGRRVPLHSVQVEVMAARGETAPDGVTESLVRAVAEVLAPLKVTETSSGVGVFARRGGWKIGPGRELWLHENVLSDGLLSAGMSKERVGQGWLYSVPDDWSVSQVVTAHDEFRELNRLDVLPH
ncbi:hypothetical protein AB1K54_14310 [Microbacterium sp. BWT-B31]|uniref:hypothetical protein n=1 Tax=Microbacterium sp. BWT-B31 TaxID=3232072 RepID=UPI003527A143